MKQPATSLVLSPTFLSKTSRRSMISTRRSGRSRFSSRPAEAPEKAPPMMMTSKSSEFGGGAFSARIVGFGIALLARAWAVVCGAVRPPQETDDRRRNDRNTDRSSPKAARRRSVPPRSRLDAPAAVLPPHSAGLAVRVAGPSGGLGRLRAGGRCEARPLRESGGPVSRRRTAAGVAEGLARVFELRTDLSGPAAAPASEPQGAVGGGRRELRGRAA